MAEYIIRENEREKGCAQESIDETKNRILKAAGNLIKTEILEQIYTNEYYPSIDDIAAKNWIPNNLQKLLRVLIQSEVKVQSIGQAIKKSSTRTALTPILFGLGVELDLVFGSNSSLWDASVMFNINLLLSQAPIEMCFIFWYMYKTKIMYLCM